MSQRIHRNLAYLADTSGTGVWRHIFQMLEAGCIGQKLGMQNTYTEYPILDQNYYRGITSVTVQRWISDQQLDLMEKFLRPVTDANSAWLLYGIDDAMHYNEIPLFNRGRFAFANDKIQSNIAKMLNMSDFVVVTTDHIKEYYNKTYGVPLENIIAAPNLLPRFWFGDRYDPDKKVEQFKKNKAKPRIGIVSSLSHYNVDGVRKHNITGKACRQQIVNGVQKWIDQDNAEVKFEDTEKITDDFDDIVDTIRSTVDDFQYVCFGYCPPQIKDLADKGKIEVHGGVSILQYPSMLENLKLQAIIAMIKPTEFNFCKSHIKYLEASALGVPLFATNCLPYSNVMPKSQLIDGNEDLKDKLLKLKFASAGVYRTIIENQWKWLNSPKRDGDFNITNGWLDDNLNIWTDLFKLRPKGLRVSFSNFVKQHEAHLAEQKKRTIFESPSGNAKIVQ